MKEADVKGLMALKKKYNANKVKPAKVQSLGKEFQGKSLALIKAAVKEAGWDLKKVPGGFKPGTPLADGDGCGFCTKCITSCVNCVAYA